jgi:hypothetical protein
MATVKQMVQMHQHSMVLQKEQCSNGTVSIYYLPHVIPTGNKQTKDNGTAAP